MTKIKKIIHRDGFIYHQLKRTEKVAIYAQFCPECNTRVPYTYEVFKIKIQRRREVFGRVFPEQEKFPANEAFGYGAWVYRSYEKAQNRYKELKLAYSQNE